MSLKFKLLLKIVNEAILSTTMAIIRACMNGNTYFLVRVCFVESATGRSIWLTLFDQCMAGLLDINTKDFSVMDESMQFYKMNTLIGTPHH